MCAISKIIKNPVLFFMLAYNVFYLKLYLACTHGLDTWIFLDYKNSIVREIVLRFTWEISFQIISLVSDVLSAIMMKYAIGSSH